MKVATKALVPALALMGALALPPLAEAGHRHGPGCGHRGYSSGRYYDRSHHHRARPHAHSYRYRPYRPGYYGYGYGYGYRPAPPPYAYGYYPGYYGNYGYYPPPPPYRVRPRVGVSLYLGF